MLSGALSNLGNPVQNLFGIHTGPQPGFMFWLYNIFLREELFLLCLISVLLHLLTKHFLGKTKF